jgi:hypothetical protein
MTHGQLADQPIISQDEDSLSAANTRQQRQTPTLMQDYMFQVMEIPDYKPLFIPAQAAARKYPCQFLCTLLTQYSIKTQALY